MKQGYENLKVMQNVVFKNSFIYYAVAFTLSIYMFVVWSFCFIENSEFFADLLIYS